MVVSWGSLKLYPKPWDLPGTLCHREGKLVDYRVTTTGSAGLNCRKNQEVIVLFGFYQHLSCLDWSTLIYCRADLSSCYRLTSVQWARNSFLFLRAMIEVGFGPILELRGSKVMILNLGEIQFGFLTQKNRWAPKGRTNLLEVSLLHFDKYRGLSGFLVGQCCSVRFAVRFYLPKAQSVKLQNRDKLIIKIGYFIIIVIK